MQKRTGMYKNSFIEDSKLIDLTSLPHTIAGRKG
jgi:hypothetical protein